MRKHFVWTLCLVGLAAPLHGQPGTPAPVRDVTTESAVPVAANVTTAGNPDDSWSRVRELASNADVAVTVAGSPPIKRRLFVIADESGLTVLNVDDLMRRGESGAVRALREMNARHPDHLTEFTNGNVRVGAAGVFVGPRKVAERDDVIERIARTDVIRVVMSRVSTHGSPKDIQKGVAVGALALVGAAGGGTGPNFCTEHPSGCVGVAIGGPIVGGLLGYFFGHGETVVEDVVIYSVSR
jgi:hypothetical protein